MPEVTFPTRQMAEINSGTLTFLVGKTDFTFSPETTKKVN